jgi:putative phage-type endonuclease
LGEQGDGMNDIATLQQVPAGHDRRKVMGGSDVAAVFGVSPWLTPLGLYEKKTNPFPDEDITPEKRKFFSRRKRQEPVIAEMLADEYGIVVTRLSLDEDPNRYVDPEYPFMVAEVDFEFLMSPEVRDHFPDREDFAAIPDGTLLNGEIKTVHPFKASEWGEQGSEEVPIHYSAQIMHGLGVTGKPAALVAALFGLDILLCFPVMRDEETIAAMREKVITFWTQNVLAGVPPEPVNVDDVKRMYSKFNGKPAELSDEAFEALIGIDTVRARKRQADLDLEELEWRVARSIAQAWGVPLADGDKPNLPVKDNALLMHMGMQVGSWNRQSRSGIDVKRLREERPEIASAYATSSQFRVFRLKKEKQK